MSFDFALINGDLHIEPDGTMKTVQDTDKLRQEILKIVLTELGSNVFHPWYGCTISEDIIGSSSPNNMITIDIQDSIQKSLDNLQKLQQQQLTSQKVSLAELIQAIGPIISYKNPEDPRQIQIEILVYTKRLTEIQETLTLTT